MFDKFKRQENKEHNSRVETDDQEKSNKIEIARDVAGNTLGLAGNVCTAVAGVGAAMCIFLIAMQVSGLTAISTMLILFFIGISLTIIGKATAVHSFEELICRTLNKEY